MTLAQNVPAPSPSEPPLLTSRQIECLRRIACGETSAQIAKALGLSRHTVNHYISAACVRLGAKNRAQAVVRAIALNLVPAPDVGKL